MSRITKQTIVSGMIALAGYSVFSAVRTDEHRAANHEITSKKDSIISVQAFEKVYAVLMSPRCMNCHPAGDVPLQGDDSHLHEMKPARGPDGKGMLAMKCANCHQPENSPGPHAPPGHPEWHLPPADMKMVFEGKTPHELARQLLDPQQNGHKNLEELIAHADDGLVIHSWDMGEGREPPPLSHADFKKAWTTWLEKGAFAPAADKGMEHKNSRIKQ